MPEEFTEILIDDMPIAILIIDRNYNIVFANKQAHLLFHYNIDELKNKNISSIMPIKSSLIHKELADEYWNNNPHAKVMGSGRDIKALTKDNIEIPVEVGLYPYKDTMIAIIADLGIRKIKEINTNLKNIIEQVDSMSKIIAAYENQKKN